MLSTRQDDFRANATSGPHDPPPPRLVTQSRKVAVFTELLCHRDGHWINYKMSAKQYTEQWLTVQRWPADLLTSCAFSIISYRECSLLSTYIKDLMIGNSRHEYNPSGCQPIIAKVDKIWIFIFENHTMQFRVWTINRKEMVHKLRYNRPLRLFSLVVKATETDAIIN